MEEKRKALLAFGFVEYMENHWTWGDDGVISIHLTEKTNLSREMNGIINIVFSMGHRKGEERIRERIKELLGLLKEDK